MGYAFQMWPSWPSLMGSIHTWDPHPAVSTIHPFKACSYSAFVLIKSSVLEHSTMLDILANPVVDGRVSPGCCEGGVQSAEPDRGCFGATCTPTLLLSCYICLHWLFSTVCFQTATFRSTPLNYFTLGVHCGRFVRLPLHILWQLEEREPR